MSPFTRLICLILLMMVSLAADAQEGPSFTSSGLTPAEADEALRFHNESRKELGVEPLTWSATLASFAQAWADQLAASGCKPAHRPRHGEWKQQYGENIFWGNGKPYVALDASKSWQSEKKDYTYGPIAENTWYATGHYTQMVWRNTQQVGIGKATCANGAVIIVANYYPAGNVMGQKPY